jgi:magnesium chelatase family protein
MLAKLSVFALVGIDALPVEVEVDVAAGLPKTVLVGLPELAVRESVHRIERALVNLGYNRPSGRTIINLAPADLRKDAGAFDLPIALGMLVATGQVNPEQLADSAAVGELALDGAVRPVKGALSIALAARERGLRQLLVPRENAPEAAVVEEIKVFAVTSLAEAVGLVTGQLEIEPVAYRAEDVAAKLNRYDVDFAEVRGQEFAKRAMVLAAAGSHNLLMIGSPGSGKSMLTKRLPTILPPLIPAESLDTTRIYSATGLLPPGQALLSVRPFRSPLSLPFSGTGHRKSSRAGLCRLAFVDGLSSCNRNIRHARPGSLDFSRRKGRIQVGPVYRPGGHRRKPDLALPDKR